ncbi:hypothetical protein [uncultured Dysosmobacter sp.]|uniref:hypothetical protein n=1 Tax=uncultured Dysosmobacter sp. TaxID=2591384 RepID=UPI002623576D|nr:hypothetical protein [uncultured Dysosmobacter sp.]
MNGLYMMAAIFAALLVGMVWGVKLEDSAWRRAGKHRSRKRWTTSKLIAVGVLVMDSMATIIVLGLCGLAILRQFSGALPYLTTLIGALQAATGYVLGHYFKKSCKENTKGGITYDAALGNVPDSGTGDL